MGTLSLRVLSSVATGTKQKKSSKWAQTGLSMRSRNQVSVAEEELASPLDLNTLSCPSLQLMEGK